MYTQPLAEYMAKLYWRIKKEGKWTWRTANVYADNAKTTIVYNYREEEE